MTSVGDIRTHWTTINILYEAGSSIFKHLSGDVMFFKQQKI